MGYWNYRICYETVQKDKILFSIYEVYYEKNGNIYDVSSNPVTVWGESPEDLQNSVAQLHEAFQMPPIDLDELLPRIQTKH